MDQFTLKQKEGNYIHSLGSLGGGYGCFEDPRSIFKRYFNVFVGELVINFNKICQNKSINEEYMGVSLNDGTPKTPQNDHF